MPNLNEVAQLVGSVGSVLVAAVAIINNSRTTRTNLDAQRETTTTQLIEQRKALSVTLSAQAQQIRDERLWDRRMALYEDLGAWSGKAYSSVSRLMFDIEGLSEEGFEECFREPFDRLEKSIGVEFFPLLGRVRIYAGDGMQKAFLSASPSILGLRGDYSKANASDWAADLFTAVTNLQDVLQDTIRQTSGTGFLGADGQQDEARHWKDTL